MDFPTLGLNFDLTEIVQGIRTLDQAERAVLRFGDATERTAARSEAAQRRMSAATRRGAEETARANSRAGKTVEERQFDAAVAALNGRMAFQRRMGAQRIAQERREAAEAIASDRAVATAAASTVQMRMRLARQRAAAEVAAERQVTAAVQAAERAAQKAAEQTFQFRRRMTQQRIREEQAAARAAAAAEAAAQASAGGRGGGFLGGGGGDGGAGRFTGALGGLNNMVGRLRNTFLNLRFVIAGVLGAMAVGPIIQMTDAMTALDARIGIYADRASDVPYTFEALYQAAQTSRQPLEAMATLYTRLAPLADQLGKSQLDLVRITETVAKSFAISGSTAAEAASSSQQLAQALAANRLGGDELRSLAENAPVLMNEIAKALDMNVGQFIKWAHEGRANAEVVINAIEEAGPRINAIFEKMPVTIGQSVTVVGNAMTHLIDRVNQMTGTSERIAAFISGFADFLEAESTINGVAKAIEFATQAISLLGDVIGGVVTYLPAFAAGLAALLVVKTVAAGWTAMTKALLAFEAASAIAGGRMAAMQGGMALLGRSASGLVASLGGIAGILTGGLVLAVTAAVGALIYLDKTILSATEATERMQSSQENAIGALERAISFSETFGRKTDALSGILGGLVGATDAATTATDGTSAAHARATQQAVLRANAERILTAQLLMRAAAEAGKTGRELVDSAEGRDLAIAGRRATVGVRNYWVGSAEDHAREREFEARQRGAQDREYDQAIGQFGLSRSLYGQATELFRNPLTADDVTVPDGRGTTTNTGSARSGSGNSSLDGAINRIATLREEVRGLEAQIASLLTSPLDPLADLAARIKAAGDEAAARFTAGDAADAGFAEQARTVAAMKEERQIRLQLLQTLVEQRRRSADEQAQLAATTAARVAQNQIMSDFWSSSDRSAAGYAAALRASAAAETEGLKRQEELRIARTYGVDALDQIAEAYSKATGASLEEAQALEDQAIAAARAAGATIELTRAEQDAAAAAEASLARRAQTADTLAYAEALGRGTEALAEYNRQLRIRAAIEANRGLDPAAAAQEVDNQIAAEDAAYRAERTRSFEEDLRLAEMSAQQREIEAVAMARVADAIARGSQDAEALSIEAQRARAAYEAAALAVARLKGQVKSDIREAFAETGKIDFTSLKENLTRRIREAVYDAMLAKPIDMVVNAVVNVVTKGLEKLLGQLVGGDGSGMGSGLGDMFKSGMDDLGNQLKSLWNKVPKGWQDALKGVGKTLGGAAAGYSIGNSVADMMGFQQNDSLLAKLWEGGAAIAGQMIGGPIGATIATIAARFMTSLFADKKRPLAITALEVQNGRFVSRGTAGYDGGPTEEIDQMGRDMANLLNKLSKAFGLDLSKANGLGTVFGWTAGENTKALGGEGFFGGMLKEVRDLQGMTLDQIKGSALGRGVDLSRVKDAEEAIDKILRETLIRVGDAVGDAFTEAEKAVIRAAESLEEAAATLMAARNIESTLERALLRFTNPTEFALANLRDQQLQRRTGIRDLVDQGLVSEDRLPGIEALLQELERNEIAEALANLANGADGAAASLEQLQEAQERIRAYVDGLRTGQLSPLAPAAQLELSRERFNDLLTRAQGGDLTALETITDSSSEFLDAARRFYGSSEAYARIFDTVYGALDALADQEFNDPLIDAIETQIQRLIDAINAGFLLIYDGDDQPPVTPDVPTPPVVPGTGGGGGGGWDTGSRDGGRPTADQDLLDRVDRLQATMADVGAAIVEAQKDGSRQVADATLDQASLNGALKGGKVSQAKAA